MKVSLTDICDFQGGTQPPKDEWIDQPAQGYVRMLQIRDFTQSDKNYIEYVKDTGKLKTCIEDDILIGRYGASIGKILTGLAGAYNVAIVKTIPDEKVVSKKYLYWYLNSQYFQRFISNVGSRAAQAGFNKNDLGAAQIPLVDKERQEEICEVLEKANKLISLRKQQLAKLDALVKVRFVEMFGDFEFNPKEFPVYHLCELCDVGSSKRIYQEEQRISGIPFLKVADLNELIDTGKYSCSTFIPLERYEQLLHKELTPTENDILITSRGTLGKCYIVQSDDEFYFQDGMISWLSNFSPKVSSIYISYLFAQPYIQKQIESLQAGSTVAYLSIAMLKKINVILPPKKLQDDFATFVEHVDQQKQTVQQSLEKLELMKKALMQEYFG